MTSEVYLTLQQGVFLLCTGHMQEYLITGLDTDLTDRQVCITDFCDTTCCDFDSPFHKHLEANLQLS